ncbi:DNA primase [Gordonia phage Kampe]|uniref:DNA primase n=3 Tax=Gordonia phage Orchid TaxID=1838075 RepID=A0A160DJG3_9CAUD|nr:helicase [Gordonia phage Orchid]ANA87235.1 DNA primase [Gordonia phage PatrickStar]ANA87350.1 DNA primase [Gordonia phage Orchid]ANA87464.1 DNA primase [Gordonia phage Kampe]
MNVFDANPALRAKIEAKLAEQKAAQVQAQPPVMPVPINPPSSGLELAEFTEDTIDDGAKSKLKNYDITQAYLRWFSPKDMKDSGNGNYLTNCFNSNGHSNGDSNPSLCLKVGENVYTCYGCNISGDMVDLAGVHAGISDGVNGTPDNLVHEIVKTACMDLFPDMQSGWKQVGDKNTWIYDPSQHAQIVAPADPTKVDDDDTDDDFDNAELEKVAQYGIALDWKEFFRPTTPGYNYMSTLCGGEVPDEYHFWNYLCLIGAICGRDVFFPDEVDVYGNLFTCIVGKSGGGKSRSEAFLNNIIENSVPFRFGDKDQRGVKIIEGAGSGEALTAQFQHHIKTAPLQALNMGTTNQKSTPTAKPTIEKVDNVRGIVRYSEFSHIVAKSSVKGSALESILQQLYDTADRPVGGFSQSGGDNRAYKYFACVNTTTQFKSIRKLISNDQVGSGFINRWVFVIGTPKQKTSRGKRPIISNLYSDFIKLSNWAYSVKVGNNGMVDLPSYDYPLFDDYCINVAGAKEDESDILGRSRLLLKKLTLLLAINNRETIISDQTILDAQKLFEYTVRCSEFVEGTIKTSESTLFEREVYDFVLKEQGTFSTGHEKGPNIKNIMRRFRKNPEVTMEKVTRILRNFQAAGMIISKQDNRPGPGRRLGLMYIIPQDQR